MTLEEKTRIVDASSIKGILIRVGGKTLRGNIRGLARDFPVAVVPFKDEIVRYEISWDLARRAVDEGVVIL